MIQFMKEIELNLNIIGYASKPKTIGVGWGLN